MTTQMLHRSGMLSTKKVICLFLKELTLLFLLFVEIPQSEVGGGMDLSHYQPSPCVSHNGFLFKTASMARAVTERKGKEGMRGHCVARLHFPYTTKGE